MHRAMNCLTIGVFALVFALATSAGPALGGNNPIDENWWPSEFGADDERGAVNYITAAKILEAVKLVKQGKVASLGRVYHNHMPLIPGRTFALSIPGAGGSTHSGSWGIWPGDAFEEVFNDELLIAEIGQVGTQFDGLGHPGLRITNSGNPCWPDGDYYYNKFRTQDYNNTRGLKRMGVHNIGGIVTRGIMVDMAAYRGKDMLEAGDEYSLADYKGALRRQGTREAGKGDVVIFRGNWGSLWIGNIDNHGNLLKTPEQLAKDHAKFGGGEPGPGPEVCEYLGQKKITMIASDSWATEAYPHEHETFAYCHINLVARRGIYNFENLDVEQLHNDKVYEFMFAWGVIRLQGATGAPGNPLAIY